MGNLRYLARCIASLGDAARRQCPNCGGSGDVVARKYAVTALRRCAACQLLYRTPADSPAEAETFYNEAYVQGQTTALPSPERLEAMKANGFAELESDYAGFAALLKDFGVPPGGLVFDYGCSWGYGSYLLARAGFRVKSYEISRPRRSYGEQHLGIDLAGDFDAFAAANPGSFDCFFSAHVLEHVPSPSAVIAAAFALLKPGGLFVSCFPNGSAAYRASNPAAWQALWGEVHPNFLDDSYMADVLAGMPAVAGISPVAVTPQVLAHLAGGTPELLRLGELTGYELLVAARKPG